jgi:hypothetical protein
MGCIHAVYFHIMMSHVTGMLESNYCRSGVMFVGMISIQRRLFIVVRYEAYLRCTSKYEVRMQDIQVTIKSRIAIAKAAFSNKTLQSRENEHLAKSVE